MIPRISLLPDHVANQIAAGEVIQRPASVVKELLENAVDAKASTIQLILKDAGKTLIQVIDDGLGMNKSDVKLAFERHATSKINIAEDLFALNTKGFRGEALASIAAISNIETHTRTNGEEVSQCIKIEGSKIIDQSLSTKPKGTSIEVRNLFFNIPARRNFLKSDAVELRHIINEFQRVALAHPEINFFFFNNGNELFDLELSNLRKRIVSIFGSKWDNQLVPIEESTSLAKLKGFVIKPEFSKKTRGQQFFFVNNRFIKSPFLHHSVNSAFDGLLRSGYHPGYFLYLNVDPKTIDINIHPSKTEIKFEEEQSIYAILRSAVKHSLGIFHIVPTLDFNQNRDFDIPYNFKEKIPKTPHIQVDSSFNPFKDQSFSSKQNNDEREGLLPEVDSNNDYQDIELDNVINITQSSRFFQLFSKYIVCPLQTSILLIDQSRAHQRILYERFLASITTKTSLSQQLLFPLEVELNVQQIEEFNHNKEILLALGFQMELKNKKKLVVVGSPEHCPHSKIESIIEKLLSGENFPQSVEYLSQADQIAKTLAKTLSIKSGDILTPIEQQVLLDDFFGCKETGVSPFNRSIFISLEKSEIEKKLN
jgi:DNA mismatch repair protein MutL